MLNCYIKGLGKGYDSGEEKYTQQAINARIKSYRIYSLKKNKRMGRKVGGRRRVYEEAEESLEAKEPYHLTSIQRGSHELYRRSLHSHN